MKSCRVFIKSNYIKKAKDDWVHFEANILTNDKLYNLKLISINSENKSEGTLKRFNSTTNGFKVFLNLSEFKSIDIKPINFRNSERYAIKLVPSGFLNYKKLLIIPENEEDFEKLCGVLSQNVHKSHNDDGKITEFNNGTIRSQNSHNVAENKTKKVEETKISPPSPEELSEEVYFSMDDNDVYDGNSLENSYTVCVEESIDSKRLGLKGSFILRLKEEGLELVDIKTGEVVHKFPYIFIRRFGAKNDILRLEAGRKCTSGEGYLMFRFKNAQIAVETIREFVKELKKTASASQNDCSTLNNSHRNSVALSINSSNLDCVNDTLTKRNNWSNSTSPISSPKSMQSNFVANAQSNNLNNSFFVEDNVASPKPSPPAISPKPINTGISPMTLNRPNKTVNYPVYSAINHNRNNISSPSVRSNVTNGPRLATLNRPPIINNNFNRNHQIASSFVCRRPTQVNIPVIKDDSYCPKANTSEVYDNMPMYERKNDRNQYLSNNNNSSVRYASSYSMQGPIGITHDGNYDNVPNSQRCIKDLENMLNDLGIPQH